MVQIESGNPIVELGDALVSEHLESLCWLVRVEHLLRKLSEHLPETFWLFREGIEIWLELFSHVV